MSTPSRRSSTGAAFTAPNRAAGALFCCVKICDGTLPQLRDFRDRSSTEHAGNPPVAHGSKGRYFGRVARPR